MREDQRYIADSLRTMGIGLIVSGIVGAFFGKATVAISLAVTMMGIAITTIGFYYVKRRYLP